MKKVINQRRYNTETAENVGQISDNGCNETEILYQKNTGEYFLYTKKSEDGTENLHPLDYDQAKSWAKAYLNPEKYKSLFETIPDNEAKQKFAITVKACNIEKLKRLAAKRDKTRGDIIDELIEREQL